MTPQEHLAREIDNGTFRPCPTCGAHDGLVPTITASWAENGKGHYAAVHCHNVPCRHRDGSPKHVDWLSTPPELKTRKKRPGIQAALVKRKGLDYCQLCQRHESELPEDGPTSLEAHHLDGDHTNQNLDNILTVCRHCHQLIQHIQTYFGHYHGRKAGRRPPEPESEVAHAPS